MTAMLVTTASGEPATPFLHVIPPANAFAAPLAPGLCATCRKPMADGGSPLPGEGKQFIEGFGFLLLPSCASCWRDFLAFSEVDDGPNDVCHHGIAFSEPCDRCDDEIEAGMPEIID